MSLRDWCWSVIHNCVIHPLLPLATLCTASGIPVLVGIGDAVYRAHDQTVPEEE